MDFDRSGSTIFRVKLNSAERKALNAEIDKSYEAYDIEHWMEIDAMVLWVLHTKFGWGHKRLREFYDSFGPAFEELLKRYEMKGEEGIWLCTKQLKDYGVDLEEWGKERLKHDE